MMFFVGIRGYILFFALILIIIYLIYTTLMNKSNIKRLNQVLVLICNKFELDVDSLNEELDDEVQNEEEVDEEIF